MNPDTGAIWNAIALIMQQLHTEYPLGAIFEHAGEVRYCRNGQWIDLAFAMLHPDTPRYYVQDWRDLSMLAGAGLYSLDEVTAMLDPIRPDQLRMIGPNIFEAVWQPPVRMIYLEILRGTPGVVVLGEPYPPPEQPDGLAVRFSVQ